MLEQFTAARGLAGVEFIEEVGGGLNYGRKKFVALLDSVGHGEVAVLVLAHRDRFTRFGFEWYEHLPEQEMVQDLMTIVPCFSNCARR